jgi:hypothetical protein
MQMGGARPFFPPEESMSQYSNAQTPTKLEVASGDGSPKDSESAKPVLFNGTSESGGGAKLGAVTAGHSSKVGKVG